MPPTIAALLAAALASAGPPARGELYAQVLPRDAALGAFPSEQLEDVTLGALPPPPDTVIRETRYYGTVTVDHRAHLARRAACKSCHGTGAVTKLELPPRVAHDRCVGCHREQAAGPTDCKGCHVKRATPPPTQLAAAAPCPPAEPAKPSGPDASNLAAALAAFGPPREGAGGGFLGVEPFHRWLELGLAAGHGQGVSVRVASHQNFVVVSQSVERLMSSTDARTLGLLGAGLSRPVHSRVAVEVVGLAGFDAVDRPLLALLPAVGARAGLEWRPRLPWLEQVTAAVTGVHDLSTRRAAGGTVGGTTVYGTVSTGFGLHRK